jgi:DNA-binding CsgD family transcriptional regulator
MEDGSFAGFYFLEVDDKGVYRDGDIEIGTLEAPCFIEYINKISKSPAEDEKEIFASVCSVYEGNKSIKKTAQLLSISEERVRRILITEGLYTCALHKQISELLNQGKPIDEIADILKMKPKNIRTYLPYDKGFESSL